MPGTGKDQENHNGHSPGIDSSTRSAIPPARNPQSATFITGPGNSSDQEERDSK
jgi:hypothetical protein